MDQVMTEQILPVVEVKRIFKAPVDAVYRAWTEAGALAAWMGPEGVTMEVDHMDLREGGAYRYVMQQPNEPFPVAGTFLEVVPNNRLAFTWAWEEGEIGGVETVVELSFAEVDGGTELTLAHSKLPTETAREKHTEGWNGCLDCLVSYLAG